jgi:Chaperone of endosialidase
VSICFSSVPNEKDKDDTKPMEKASEVISALKPVTFRYKKEIDPAATPQFGLVAEEVEKVNPDLWCATPMARSTPCATTR